jgi:NitT/TauT family transport system substrate-binding protein
MRTRKLIKALLVAAMTMTLAAGCSTPPGNGAFTSAPVNPEEPDITVAAIPAADLGGLYVAQDDGLFAAQGLHVTIEKIASSQAITADQLKGQVDISAGSYVAYLSAQAAGARFRILAEASTLRPDTRALVTTERSPLTTIAALANAKIGVNGTGSIGTLLVSMVLQEHGISPRMADFITDPEGFPAMPQRLQDGAWDAAFLAEPYITVAGEQYGEQEVADLDQGDTMNLPIDGYVSTLAWARKHPKTATAFVRAIEAGQALATSEPATVQAAVGKFDQLPTEATALMALPSFPTGPVSAKQIQRVASAMLQFGLLNEKYTTEVQQGTLVESMIGPEPGMNLPSPRSITG